MSLKSSTSEDVHDLSIIKDATQTIINYYHTQMSNADKKLSLRSVKHGLSILLVLLKHGEQYNVIDMMKEWGVVDLIQLVQTSFPDFDDKDKLCSQFLLLLPSSSHNDDELEIVNDGEEKVREVITLVQWLRCYDGRHNFLPRIMKVLKMETSSSSHSNLSLFLIHHGILALHNIITSSNTSTSFIEGALSIIEYVASRGEEEACQVVLQGGLRAFIFLLSSTPPRPVVRGILKCLPHFIAHEETVVVMAAENMTHLLQNVQDKYSLPSEDVDIINVVSKAVKAKDVCDISSRYSCILWNIFTGTLGHVVNEIEECRRDQQLPNVPLLNSLVNFLSSNGITFTSSNTNDCIDKLEVSSNDYTKNNLIDNGDTSFWESDGRANLHWIRLYLKRNVIIKKLSISVRESDLRYLPNDVSVHGGTNVDDIVELNTVNWHQNRWQDAYSFETNKSREILSNCKRHYPLIVIKLKKNQSNVHRDIRIRGITIEPSSWSFWPSFENSFINRTQLYYHIQSHTWAITHSSSDLLGVFDKLNRAVEHEQSFADHYLMTRPSRISLGLACKASLFTPFTAGLQDGGRWNEAFMALLKDYLDGCNVKSCTSWYQDMIGSMIATDRVITNLVKLDQIKIYSKIRKMCRLLVDCDVTKPVVNEDNEDMKTNGHIITDTLKALWSRIVYQEVSSYLSRANLSDPLIFIMNDILFMYDKLHQVTQELFGHHPQLLLALKNGYSKAYQNMNEVNSIKFCEIFSLIIDMLMDASNKDIRHLSDSQRESLVIHMSFPLQFIHNLDMSHVFEYFYTKHLSRRLLNRSTLSVVIETRVGHTFSLCFPNDTPLKMLLDVTDSEKLSEDFSRLYLIREIDHLLYRCDEEVSDELVELADKLDLYQKGTLNVIVMTHHHWPLYHRPLPHLPHPLAMFVEDYNKFYASSAIGHSVRAYERNRQLKWTLYGNGVLEYNKKYQLKASTRQMIVLLHFNDYEEVSHVMLQELTHLPVKELDEVIIELTCDGNNILQSTDVGSSKLNTLYRINESFTAKSQHSFEITLEKVHGKVPGRPCCSEIENDLSRVFERRCAIIDGAIVRLLKREKEIKSDIITSRIIKGCCVGHFDDTRISFGRFTATPRDVHSRISNLISKGFIERKPNHYHTLIYLPDPSQDTKVSHGHIVMKKHLLHHVSLRDDEEIPFISPSLGAITLLEGDIKLAIHKEIQELSDVMCLPYDQVESLHHQFSWNSDELLQDYFSDKDEVLKGCGLIPASSLLPSVSMTCLICLTSDATSLHSLWCRHNCCHSCWYKYLQSWVSSCNINISCSCPVNGCAAKLTRKFFGNILESNSEILLEYDKLLVRSYVQCSSTLSWCRNPQGCDGILEKKDVYRNGACTKCSWSSCFYCTFMEGHEPCSCEDIAKWVELGGYYSGMDKDAQSKHLANVISKRCPGCNAQIEKNEGCLHMKCACGHHFCWKCMKPWQPTHTDYYSCTASESKVAQDIKKFTLYDQKCGAFHKSVSSSDKLLQCVTNIREPAVPIKMLSFLIDACQLLKESFKMLAYSCVAEYFCDGNSFEYLRSVSSALGQNVSALQEFLETVMTTSHDVINLSSNLSDHKLQEGSKLLSKIRVAKEKLLLDNIQNYELGEGVATSVDWTMHNEDIQASRPINDLLSSNILINSLLYFNDGPIAVDDDDDYFDIDDDYHDYDDYDDYDYDDDYYCGSSYDS
jgi:p53-associated parkin-like cytoplasmic protein